MARPNDKIGPYTLISKLGRGAFGVVWLAEKRTLIATTKVALKLPNDEDVDVEAIKREASLWAQASGHPNILPIIDADIYDDQIVIVSEYAPDGSLTKWLEQHEGKAPSLGAAVEMTLGILAGLEHLHQLGIIHRDLKPDNILLQRGTPRLADFGIARVLKTTSRSTVATGTPAYMSPEAFDGKRSVQTDIWSVGVIFYKLLSGHLPFQQADIASLLAAILTREAEVLPTSIPMALQRVVEQALQKSPAQRFKSASEMEGALRGASQSLKRANSNEAKTEVLAPNVIALPPPFVDPTPPQPAQKQEATRLQQTTASAALAQNQKDSDLTVVSPKVASPSPSPAHTETAAGTLPLTPQIPKQSTITAERPVNKVSKTVPLEGYDTWSPAHKFRPLLMILPVLLLLIAVALIFNILRHSTGEGTRDEQETARTSSNQGDQPTQPASSPPAEGKRDTKEAPALTPVPTPKSISVSTPTPKPTPRAGPAPTTTPTPTSKPTAPISGGVLNGKAISLPKPPYPAIARAAHAGGTVTVQVVIDENGNVISAHAVSGHPLLQASAVAAARQARFSPTLKAGQPVKVSGVITYNFVAQ